MRRTLQTLAATGFLALGMAGHSAAQDNFYAGKTINIVVGAALGGGYDLYSRALAQYMPKYIPGSPAVVVQNMNSPLPTANHVYTVAPKDGTTIGVASATFIPYQILGGPNANFEAEKLAWLGRLSASNGLFISWHTSGVATIQDVQSKEIPFGATPANLSYPLLANDLLGTRFKIVPGYKGEEIDAALEREEIAASARMTVEGLFSRYADWVKDKKVHVLMQSGDKRDPRLPDIPTFRELASSESDRQLVDLVTLASDFGQSYYLSPEVPADRLEILREAFVKTVNDPEFQAVMKRLGTSVRYESPDYLSARIASAAAVPADVKAKAAKIILPK